MLPSIIFNKKVLLTSQSWEKWKLHMHWRGHGVQLCGLLARFSPTHPPCGLEAGGSHFVTCHFDMEMCANLELQASRQMIFDDYAGSNEINGNPVVTKTLGPVRRKKVETFSRRLWSISAWLTSLAWIEARSNADNCHFLWWIHANAKREAIRCKILLKKCLWSLVRKSQCFIRLFKDHG